MIALLTLTAGGCLAIGLVIGEIIGSVIWYDRGYQDAGKRHPARDPLPFPQAPKPLPDAMRDHQQPMVLHLVRIASQKGKY